MFVKDVKVENQVGLHDRPARFFIQKANEFKSSIWVEKEERKLLRRLQAPVSFESALSTKWDSCGCP